MQSLESRVMLYCVELPWTHMRLVLTRQMYLPLSSASVEDFGPTLKYRGYITRWHLEGRIPQEGVHPTPEVQSKATNLKTGWTHRDKCHISIEVVAAQEFSVYWCPVHNWGWGVAAELGGNSQDWAELIAGNVTQRREGVVMGSIGQRKEQDFIQSGKGNWGFFKSLLDLT